MAKTTHRYTVKGNNGSREYIPPELLDINYYKRLGDKLSKLNSNLPYLIDTVDVNTVKVGFFDRAVLKNITLLDKNQNVLHELFAKLYYPMLEGPEISEQPRSLPESIKYQYCHMYFWNKHLLPSPRVLDYLKRKVSIAGEKRELSGLVMDYWVGRTHDLDLIAIDSRLDVEKKREINLFLTDRIKKEIKNNIKFLENLKSEIILSSLRTINEFAILGTYFLKNPSNDWDKGLENQTYELEDPTNQNLEKISHYLERTLIWKMIRDGKLSGKEVRKGKIPKEELKKLKETSKKFKELITDFVIPFSDQSNWRYSQGDEFLHNMQYHPFMINGEVIIKTGMFDACHVIMDDITKSRAKCLLGPAINLSYEETQAYISKMISDVVSFPEKLNEADMRKKIKEFCKENKEESLRKFDMWAIPELICCIGRRAQHEIVNIDAYNSFINVGSINYENPFIDFPEEIEPKSVSLETYKAENVIKKKQKSLDERLEHMVNNNVSYDGKDLVTKTKRLRNFLRREGILSV